MSSHTRAQWWEIPHEIHSIVTCVVQANEVLNLLRDQLLPSALLQAVGKVAEQPSSKIKLGSLEYAISLIPAAVSPDYWPNPMSHSSFHVCTNVRIRQIIYIRWGT